MQSPETIEQAKAILQFWSNLCQVEARRTLEGTSLNIIAQCKDSLMPIVFQGLGQTEFDDDDHEIEDSQDEMRWTVSRAAGVILLELASLLKDQIVDETIGFASQKLNSDSW